MTTTSHITTAPHANRYQVKHILERIKIWNSSYWHAYYKWMRETNEPLRQSYYQMMLDALDLKAQWTKRLAQYNSEAI